MDLPRCPRFSAFTAVVLCSAGLLACVENRLPTKAVDGPAPHTRVLLNVNGTLPDWDSIKGTQPAPGKVGLKVGALTGDAKTVRLGVERTASCQERDRISQELVTTIERSPKKELLAPTLLGTVGTVAGIAWSSYGLSQHASLPPPSPAASGRENRQDQLTQVTLPLTTLGISLVLLAIPAFASIDGEERKPLGDRLGGVASWRPCAEPRPSTRLRISSGLFSQPVTSAEVAVNGTEIDLQEANIPGAIQRLATLQKICTANCPTGPRSYRPLTATERKKRIEQARGAIRAFLDATKARLRGRLARRDAKYARVLSEANRVSLLMNRSQRPDLASLNRLLEAAGDTGHAETLQGLERAYREALPKTGSTQLAKGPQYIPLRPIDRLVASPWTCITSQGLNAFDVALSVQTRAESALTQFGDSVCVNWATYGPTSRLVAASRKAAAHSVLQDTLPLGAPLINDAMNRRLPLQNSGLPTTRIASTGDIAAALRAAAGELNIRTQPGDDPASVSQLVQEVAWSQVREGGDRRALADFLKAFPNPDGPHFTEATLRLTLLEREGR